jgi:hypothetical protein
VKALFAGLFTALVTAFIVVVPSFEKPDEPGHLDYIRFLLAEGRLPRPLATPPCHESHWEGHHPPLYYLYAGAALKLSGMDLKGLSTEKLECAMIVDPGAARRARASGAVPRPNPKSLALGGGDPRNFEADPRDSFPWKAPFATVRFLRFLGLPWGLLVLALSFHCAREAFGPRDPWAWAAAALAVLNPQFLFMCGAVGNDAVAAGFGAVLAALGIRALKRGRGGPSLALAGVTGAAAGLGIMAKLTNLAGAAAGTAVLAAGPRRRAGAVLVAVAVAAAVAGWWFVRNAMIAHGLFGRWEPFGALATLKAVPAYDVTHRLRPGFFLSFAPGSLPVLAFKSYWGLFGWMTVPAPGWFHALMLAASAGGLAGFLASRLPPPAPRFTRAFLGGSILLVAALMVRVNLELDAPHGRYFFAAIVPISLVIAGGLRYWARRAGIGDRAAAGAVVAAILAADGASLAILARVYGAP